MIPLPFTCQHEAYTDAVEQDTHGNDIPGWETATDVACFWWSPDSSEPHSGASFGAGFAPSGGDRVTVDLTVVVDSSVAVDHRDRFTVDGRTFEVIGLPKDYDHGPWGFRPNRLLVELRFVG